jgi:hypothetical protein
MLHKAYGRTGSVAKKKISGFDPQRICGQEQLLTLTKNLGHGSRGD